MDESDYQSPVGREKRRSTKGLSTEACYPQVSINEIRRATAPGRPGRRSTQFDARRRSTFFSGGAPCSPQDNDGEPEPPSSTMQAFRSVVRNIGMHQALVEETMKHPKIASVNRKKRLGLYLRLHGKTLVFRAIHLLVTLVIWQHFFYMKFRQKEAGVPAGAPNYWLKRLIPPLEFGLMHAILFQMCIIPITMSKNLLAYLSTFLTTVPFEHITQFHIHIGYTTTSASASSSPRSSSLGSSGRCAWTTRRGSTR